MFASDNRMPFLRRRDVVFGSACAVALSAAGRAAAPAYWPGAGAWRTVTPAEASFDAAKLAAAVDTILASDSFSVMVLREGAIVAERYGHGAGAGDRHEIASAAKSVVSVLVGMAIDAGKIKSVEQSAADFIPQWRGTPKAAITIRHLLSMTSGLDFSGLKVRDIDGDQFALNAAAPLADPPGTRWAYATPMFHLLYHVIERAVGEPFAAFARRVLLEPIGAADWQWLTNVGRGAVTNYYSALCTARELARFGLLALNGGRWQNRQLVNPEYFRASISPSQRLNPAYGYLWWENAEPGLNALGRGPVQRIFGNVPSDTFGALGFGSQVVIVIPSRSLVVVRQGPLSLFAMRPDRMIELIVAAMV